MSSLTWRDVYSCLASLAPGEEVAVPKHQILHPADRGASRSIGLHHALAHWRFPPDPYGRGLHVREMHDRYLVHLDQVHPDVDPVEHLRRDAPGLFWSLIGAGLLLLARE